MVQYQVKQSSGLSFFTINYFTFLYRAQLNEIKKQGMSALLCRSYKIKDIQRNPFLQMKNG